MKPQPEFHKLGVAGKLALLFGYPLILLVALYVSLFLYGNSDHARRTINWMVSEILPGNLHISELRILPTLNGISAFGTTIRHPNGREDVSMMELHARVDLQALLRGEIALKQVSGHQGRVLVNINSKGEPEIAELFTVLSTSDPRLTSDDSSAPLLRIDISSLSDLEILVQLPQLSVHLDGIQIDQCQLLVDGDFFANANLQASRGRLIFLPETFRLLDPHSTNSLRSYRLLRSQDPWAALNTHPSPPEGEVGLLDVSFTDLEVQAFKWRYDGFEVESFSMLIAEQPLSARGELNLSHDKQETFHFRASAELGLPPDSPILAYFTQGLLGPAASAEAEPQGRFTAELEGSLVAIEGNLALEMSHLDLAGWHLDNLSIQAETSRGGPFLFQAPTDDLLAAHDSSQAIEGEPHPLPGIRLTIGDGLLTGLGFFDSSDGRYALDLWLDGIPTERLLFPAVPDIEPELAEGLLFTTPREPLSSGAPGIHIEGDLNAKGFGSLEWARLEETFTESLNNLAQISIAKLEWHRNHASGLPFRRLGLSGELALRPYGILHISGSNQRALAVQLDRDQALIDGSLDLLTQTAHQLRVSGQVASLAALIGEPSLEASANMAMLVNGPLSSPRIEMTRLDLDRFATGPLSIGRIRTSFESDMGSTSGLIPGLDRGRVTITDLDAGPFRASSINSGFSFDGQNLRLSNANIFSDIGHLVVSGAIGLMDGQEARSDPSLNLNIRARNLDLAALVPDLPVTGSIQLDANLRGSASRPRVQGNIELTEAILFDEWIDRLSADLTYTSRGISVENLDLQVVYQDLTRDSFERLGRIHGEVHLSAAGDLRSALISASGFQLSDFANLRNIGVSIRGEPELNLEVIPYDQLALIPGLPEIHPAPGQPDIQGSIIVRNLYIDNIELGSLALSLDTYQDNIQAVGILTRDIATRIIYPFDSNQPIRLWATFDHLPIELAYPPLGAFLERGELNAGQIYVEVHPSDPPEVLVELSLGEIWFSAEGQRFHNARPIHVTYSAIPQAGSELRQSLHIPELSFGAQGRFLSLEGDIYDWENLELRLQGDINLSLASLFSSAIAEAEGSIGINLDVRDSLSAPHIQGSLTFAPSTIVPRGLGEIVTVRSGRIDIRSEPGNNNGSNWLRLFIPEQLPIEGLIFDGAFSITGNLNIENDVPRSARLSLFANNLNYTVPEMLSLTINRLDLTFSSPDLTNPSSFLLSGNVQLQEGLFFQQLAGNIGSQLTGTFSTVFAREVERYHDPLWQDLPLLQDLRLDVALRARDNFMVRTTILDAQVDLELQADLVLQGTLVNPILIGEVRILNGEILWQNRSFAVQTCVIRFDGEASEAGPLIPRIEECTANATIQRMRPARAQSSAQSGSFASVREERLEPYVIRISIHGNSPDTLQFAAESVNVSLEERDVYSLLMFGVTYDEYSTASGQTLSYALLVRQLMDALGSEVQEQFNFDEFNITPTTEGSTEISIREQVSDRFALDVGARVFGQQSSTQRITGELTLFDWLILELSETSDDENNVEVGGRLRLRIELD